MSGRPTCGEPHVKSSEPALSSLSGTPRVIALTSRKARSSWARTFLCQNTVGFGWYVNLHWTFFCLDDQVLFLFILAISHESNVIALHDMGKALPACKGGVRSH